MDGGDECFTGPDHDKKLNQMMLRFRPIAPKPASFGPGSAYLDLEQRNKELVGRKRAKRKYVRVNKDLKTKRFDETVVTLELLPGIGEMKSASASVMACSNKSAVAADLGGVESWVTLECVTEGVGGELGGTDGEKVGRLERDTCPGFVSDGEGGVRWVNPAYRRMVGGGSAEVVVWLVMKEEIPAEREAFSCRVRVVDAGGRGKVVPCDVWKMELGGYAWRLDVEAALSLGR